MTIKEMEARTGLPRANIRYYESQGFLTPVRGDNGYRDYSQQDLDTLLKVKLLRKLGFSLEEIRDIQAGRLELDSALERREQALEREQVELGQAARLCRDMCGDQVSYATLDAQRYLERLAQGDSVLDQDRLPRRIFPWRRYFARSFDLTLYTTLFHLALQLLFHENILLRNKSTAYGLLDGAIALGIMLAAETVMLHVWGTTPGKALFGLRIVREDGSCLSLAQSLQRTIMVVLLYGLSTLFAATSSLFLSLIGLALPIYCCWCVYKEKPLGWETEEQVYLDGSSKEKTYWEKRSSWLKLGGWALGWAACIGVMVLGHIFAFTMTPSYRGPGLTAEQFVDNYNRLNDFLVGKSNVAQRLTVDGTFQEVEHPDTIVFSLGDSYPDPAFTFTEENGVLTAVAISRAFQDSYSAGSNSFSIATVPYDDMALTTYAFLLGRPGVSRGDLARIIQDFSDTREDFQYDLPGASVQCDMDFRGYVPGQDYLFPVEGRDQSYTFRFTISLTD